MNIAIIFAGGVGKRMFNSAIPKQFLIIEGKPIIVHTLEVFEECDMIDKIILVMVESHVHQMKKLKKKYNLSKIEDIVIGGDTGQLSIYNGLKRAKEINSSEEKIVLIHDGVRPFISEKLILENIESVKKHKSAISCVKQNETIVSVNQNFDIESITDRSNAYIARAPQSFYLEDILGCHEKVLDEGVIDMIDSCSLMLKYKKKVHMVYCDYSNIKITTPTDYYMAKSLMEAKNNLEVLGV